MDLRVRVSRATNSATRPHESDICNQHLDHWLGQTDNFDPLPLHNGVTWAAKILQVFISTKEVSNGLKLNLEFWRC